MSAVYLTRVRADTGLGSISFDARKMAAAPRSWNCFFLNLKIK